NNLEGNFQRKLAANPSNEGIAALETTNQIVKIRLCVHGICVTQTKAQVATVGQDTPVGKQSRQGSFECEFVHGRGRNDRLVNGFGCKIQVISQSDAMARLDL